MLATGENVGIVRIWGCYLKLWEEIRTPLEKRRRLRDSLRVSLISFIEMRVEEGREHDDVVSNAGKD